MNIKCKSGKAKILGAVICIGGALVLSLYKGNPLFFHPHHQFTTLLPMNSTTNITSSTRKAERWTIGVIALVLGTLFWSSWFLLQSKIGKKYPSQYSSTAIMTFFGAIQSAILGFSTGKNMSMWILKGKIQIITVLYSVSALDIFLSST